MNQEEWSNQRQGEPLGVEYAKTTYLCCFFVVFFYYLFFVSDGVEMFEDRPPVMVEYPLRGEPS